MNLMIKEAHEENIIPDWNLPEETKNKTLVLDLDETLIHSSFTPIINPDFIFNVL